jgi:hypothetical protein
MEAPVEACMQLARLDGLAVQGCVAVTVSAPALR